MLSNKRLPRELDRHGLALFLFFDLHCYLNTSVADTQCQQTLSLIPLEMKELESPLLHTFA